MLFFFSEYSLNETDTFTVSKRLENYNLELKETSGFSAKESM